MAHALLDIFVMVQMKHILVATDFGEPSHRALELAMDFAEKFDADVTVLYANALPAFADAGVTAGLVWPTEEVASGAKKELEAAVVAAKARYSRVKGVMVDGVPWRTILDVARERGVDLIVMGTRGHGPIARALLGSVADRVVGGNTVAVLTISGRHDNDAQHTAAA
jgi:nucleotide-binding universal stress UspA family protein